MSESTNDKRERSNGPSHTVKDLRALSHCLAGSDDRELIQHAADMIEVLSKSSPSSGRPSEGWDEMTLRNYPFLKDVPCHSLPIGQQVLTLLDQLEGIQAAYETVGYNEDEARRLDAERIACRSKICELFESQYSASSVREPTEDDLDAIENALGMAKGGWGDVNGLEIIRACWKRYGLR